MKKTILIVAIVVVVLGGGYLWFSQKLPGQGNSISNPLVISGKTLDLSSKGLNSVPNYVFNQTSLEQLNISNNNITGAIQAEIRHLANLKVLNASNNNMTGVPAEIGQLKNLKILDLSNNQLTGLPNELGNLQNLEVFNISGNQYSQQDLDYIKSKLPSSTQIIN